MKDFELEEFLTDRISKSTVEEACNYVINNRALLGELFHLMTKGPAKIQWRAAWLFETVYMGNPSLINPYLETILNLFPNLPNNGIRRHISKILSLINISDKVDGIFINTCFEWIRDENVPVAVKVYCMDLLFQVVEIYPELRDELKLTLETYLPHNSAGFKSRAKKILAKL